MKTMNLVSIENQNMSAMNSLAEAVTLSALSGVEKLGQMKTLSGRVILDKIVAIVKSFQQYMLQSKAVTIITLLVCICLGEEVKPARALWLMSAILGGVASFLFGGNSIIVQVLLLAWFGLSAHMAK